MKTSKGEMLWYESARLAHGRPKPLQGKMYVIGSCEGDDDLFVMLIRVREDLPKNTCSFGTCLILGGTPSPHCLIHLFDSWLPHTINVY